MVKCFVSWRGVEYIDRGYQREIECLYLLAILSAKGISTYFCICTLNLALM